MDRSSSVVQQLSRSWDVIMTRRTILLLGLALLPGCGQSYQPTIRQVSYHADDKRIATTAPAPPEADAVCPGSGAHDKIAGKGKPGEDPKPVDEARAKLVSRARSRKLDPKALNPGGSITSAIGEAIGEMRAVDGGRDVRIGGRRLVAPKSWAREQQPIAPILAAFTLPSARGDTADAQLTVSAVGQNDPRSLRRLREQLDQKPVEGSVEHLRIGDNEVVLVESSGDSGDTSGPFPAPVSEGRYRALNATIFVGDRAYSINCTGPEKTVGERAGEFRGFLQTMKSVN